ncbi:MAG: hypothetical protein J1F05_04795 [Muribaculaceae bacterium]|nr:hypothetical protein [Muribaculaceae bacterium]
MKAQNSVRLIIYIALLFVAIPAWSDVVQFKTPDFAYPKTVIDDANKMLSYADSVKDNAGTIRLRALIERCVAEQIIDDTAAFTLPGLIESQLNKSELSSAAKAMLLIYEADLFTEIYRRNIYKYNQVQAPLDPYPDDISEWSADQFRARIIELARSAVANADNTPLDVYSESLSYSEKALSYIPDVASFINYRFIQIYKAISYGKIDYSDEILGICNKQLSMQSEASVAFLYWSVEVINHKQAINKRQSLLELYEKYRNEEAARYVLKELSAVGIYEEDYVEDVVSQVAIEAPFAWEDKMIALIRESLAEFTHWYDNNFLENKLKELTQATAYLKVKSQLPIGENFDVTLKYYFAKKISVNIYKLPAGASYYSGKITKLPVYASRKVNVTEERGDTTLTFAITKPGYYAFAVCVDDNADSMSVTSIVSVSPILGFSVYGCRESVAAAVDIISGAPLSGVGVNMVSTYRDKTQKRNLGKTDKNGVISFVAPTDAPYSNRHLSYSYKNNEYDWSGRLSVFNRYTGDDNQKNSSVVILTDRSLYHPGDSISWAIVSAEKTLKEKYGNTTEGKTFIVSLYDVNHQLVDSIGVTCDAQGRAYGRFVTKKGALTGMYSVSVSGEGVYNRSQRVVVSDFKAPEFEVEITTVSRDMPVAGDVTIEGKATTYSGMPVAEADVTLTLQGAGRWRWFMPEIKLASLSGRTDATGSFTIVIPADTLAIKPYNRQQYTDFVVTADVVSAAAETATAQRSFTIGKPYTFEIDCAELANSDRLYSLGVMAYDANGAEVALPYRWRLIGKNDGEVAMTGRAVSGAPVIIDISTLASESFYFEVEAIDGAMADKVKSHGIKLYSIKHNTMPADVAALFVPENKAQNINGKASVTVGTNSETLYVYSFVRRGDDIKNVSLHKLSKGFSVLDIDLGEGDEDVQLMLVSILNGEGFNYNIAIEKKAIQPIEITAESFRDHIAPGGTETWRFRIHKGGNGLPDAGMIATMYNRALDAIYQGSWASNFNLGTRYSIMNLTMPPRYNTTASAFSPLKYLDVKYIQMPEYKYANEVNIYGRSYNMALRKASRQYATAGGMNDLVAETVVESAVMASVATDSEAEAGVEEEADDASSRTDDYRMADTALQALWYPALTSDKEGNVDVVFNVPNANAAWQFKAFAWTDSLDVATIIKQTVANKPIMVHANLPRFMRQGDKAHIIATVYNNSDDVTDLVTTVEIFDIESGKILDTHTTKDTIAPKASTYAGIDIEAPVDASAIGYRVRSVAQGFADGEQAAIPILASATILIESTEFYLDPTATEPFEITIKPTAGASLTLQYCQNPLWTVVKAMRGISSTEDKTATGAVGHLFSALVARHILKSNPDVAAAIRQWRDNPSEEALVSMLSRNEDLKKLLLEQTPWVQAASSETKRMAALAQLLDEEASEAAISRQIETLKKLQNVDGGFSWGSWRRISSPWITESVLTTLAIAHSLGMLDKRCMEIIEPAFVYAQKEAACVVKNPYDKPLALVSALMPHLKRNAEGERVIQYTVSEIMRTWKRESAVEKAYDILILKGHGKDAEAEKVYESVRQFGVIKEGMGLNFPNVVDNRGYATIIHAYATMGASDAEIDAMRQWIIIQAQALDDLGAYNPDYVIAAVLLTGSNWTPVPVTQSVKINGHALEINSVESATGYFSQSIDNSTKELTISIAPNGITPSYGSLISISKAKMTSVKSRPGRDLSIEKRCLVEKDGKWVETDKFSLGERVRVQLTIKAKRDLEYVSIDDERPSCFEPVEQLPGNIWDGSLAFYRENLDASTRLFIDWLPKGTYHVTYDMTATLAGQFISGIATLQSQYAPELTAHSAGNAIVVGQ